MLVQVNDAAVEVPAGTTVSGLLEQLQLPRTRVAVEVNRSIVRRLAHADTILKPGDVVEVVTLVGGGSGQTLW